MVKKRGRLGYESPKSGREETIHCSGPHGRSVAKFISYSSNVLIVTIAALEFASHFESIFFVHIRTKNQSNYSQMNMGLCINR